MTRTKPPTPRRTARTGSGRGRRRAPAWAPLLVVLALLAAMIPLAYTLRPGV